MDNTAPIAKLGAISTPVPGLSASQERTWSNRSSVKPVVPTTAWMPLPIKNFRLSMTTSGWVKSMTTLAAVSASSESFLSTAATRSRSAAESTA
ncbi:Uncharacterised protein [Mycobacteroides abscessus]|nr:Uncharacterised protein [Mycobacteroides abscessus]SKU30809.1 Uncharacterised protein [Mycobacteroides abscessus subsp. abscessus]